MRPWGTGVTHVLAIGNRLALNVCGSHRRESVAFTNFMYLFIVYLQWLEDNFGELVPSFHDVVPGGET